MTRKAVDGMLFTIGLVAVAAIVHSSDNCEKYQNTWLFLIHFEFSILAFYGNF